MRTLDDVVVRGGTADCGVGFGLCRPLMAAYVATKSSVIRITESMASELKRKGLDTPPNSTVVPGADPTDWFCPTDLCVIYFLASDCALAIHGASVPVVNRV